MHQLTELGLGVAVAILVLKVVFDAWVKLAEIRKPAPNGHVTRQELSAAVGSIMHRIDRLEDKLDGLR